MKKMQKGYEIGWNYLDTAYSGTTTNRLSGNEVFPFIAEDIGVASTLAQKELKSPFCKD